MNVTDRTTSEEGANILTSKLAAAIASKSVPVNGARDKLKGAEDQLKGMGDKLKGVRDKRDKVPTQDFVLKK